jgi:hypothetical protein
MRKHITTLIFALGAWALLVWHSGYRFGTGDHVEYLPYVNYILDNSLYPHDFFLQGLIEKVPNERTVVCETFSLFGSYLEPALFVLHVLFTVLLIVGMQLLGTVLTGSIAIARIAILLNFMLFFNHALGDVELYSDALQGSSMAVGIIAFALYYFFRARYIVAFSLISIASIIHPVEGLTVFLVMASTASVLAMQQQIRLAELAKALAIYVFTAGLFIAYFLMGKLDGINALASTFDNDTFFLIYHEFRHSHHYLFSHQLGVDKLLFAMFIAIGFWAGNTNKKLFWFTLFSLLGTITYVVCSDYLHVVDIANLQFYKVSQWVKFIGLLFIVKYALAFIPVLRQWAENMWPNVAIATCAIAVVVSLYLNPNILGRQYAYYEFGHNWKAQNDMVDISLAIDKNISKQAVFVQPFTTTELKYYGRVSSYVDWKAFLKNRGALYEWYRRIQLIYGVSIADKEKGFFLQQKADAYYGALSITALQQLKKEGVTHLLLKKDVAPKAGTLILQNNTYAVYQL